MPDSEFMSCTIEPDLEISPGSMAGDRRIVTIVFTAVTEKVDQVDATWEILGPSDFKFGEPDPIFDSHTRPTKLVARRMFEKRSIPDDNRYKLVTAIERDSSNLEEASLAIVATVVGIGKGSLPPVNAIGRFAILTQGLRKLMETHGGGGAAPALGTAAFKEAAKKFVRELQDSPELERFTDFRNLPADTILRALNGANSQATTLAAMDEVADELKKAVEFPTEHKGGRFSMFTGLIRNFASLP